MNTIPDEIECRTLHSQTPLGYDAVIDDDLDSYTAASQQVQPQEKKYFPQRHFLTNMSQRDYAYTLLMNCNRLKLRNLAKEADVRRCGVKNDIVCNILHLADTAVCDERVQYTDTFGVSQRSF